MLTPQEVEEHVFAKAFNGYNMAMVDEFLDILTADYTALYKENVALKNKMKVLADKVEEYRSTEDSMRKALMTAQKMADQIVADAESKKNALLASAEKQVRTRTAGLEQEVANERARLAAAKKATATYLSKLKDLYRHELDYLNGLSHLTAEPAKPDPVDQAVSETALAVEKAVEEEIPSSPFGSPGQSTLKPEPSLYESLKQGILPEALDDSLSPTRRVDLPIV